MLRPPGKSATDLHARWRGGRAPALRSVPRLESGGDRHAAQTRTSGASLRSANDMKECSTSPATSAVMFKAASRPVSAGAEPPASSLRRLAQFRRPGSLNITASCLQRGCFTVTARASRTSRSSGALTASAARTAPVRRHPSRHCLTSRFDQSGGSANPKAPRPPLAPLPPPSPGCGAPEPGVRVGNQTLREPK